MQPRPFIKSLASTLDDLRAGKKQAGITWSPHARIRLEVSMLP